MVNNVVRTLKQTPLAAILTLLITCGLANAQPDPAKTTDALEQSSANLVDAAQEYQARTAELLRVQENEVNKATAKLEQLRQLVA